MERETHFQYQTLKFKRTIVTLVLEAIMCIAGKICLSVFIQIIAYSSDRKSAIL